MSTAVIDITTCLEALSTRLSDANAMAKAAVTCARQGSEAEAVRIALRLDATLSEDQTLHGAVCLLGRLERDREATASA